MLLGLYFYFNTLKHAWFSSSIYWFIFSVDDAVTYVVFLYFVYFFRDSIFYHFPMPHNFRHILLFIFPFYLLFPYAHVFQPSLQDIIFDLEDNYVAPCSSSLSLIGIFPLFLLRKFLEFILPFPIFFIYYISHASKPVIIASGELLLQTYFHRPCLSFSTFINIYSYYSSPQRFHQLFTHIFHIFWATIIDASFILYRHASSQGFPLIPLFRWIRSPSSRCRRLLQEVILMMMLFAALDDIIAIEE